MSGFPADHNERLKDWFFAPFAVGCATLTAIAALIPSIIRAVWG